MKTLGLDISTKTGWSLFEGDQLVSFGLITKTKPLFSDYGEYPNNFIKVATDVVEQMVELVKLHKPEIIVIEETNKTGRFGSRHSQKILEFLHCLLVKDLYDPKTPWSAWAGQCQVYYINTSDWRKKLNLSVAETKKKAKPFLKELANLQKEFAKAPKANKKTIKNQLDTLKLDLKSKCIHGKIDKKSISVAHVNLVYGLNLKKGDNDKSDAICLGEAYLKGVKTLTNKDIFETHKNEE